MYMQLCNTHKQLLLVYTVPPTVRDEIRKLLMWNTVMLFDAECVKEGSRARSLSPPRHTLECNTRPVVTDELVLGVA